MTFLGILGDDIKHVQGKSILNRFDDKFKSVFRVIIASIDKLECLAKTRLKYYVTRKLDKNRKPRY